MDAIAAIAFSLIVITAIKSKGVTRETGLFKQTIYSGVIAAIALGFIYISLGWIGNHMNVSAETLKEGCLKAFFFANPHICPGASNLK